LRIDQRSSGVLLHLTSLYNPYALGDLGPQAHAFADFLSESGQRWWQMLPIGPTGQENSPYQSMSAFGGNPLLVSPDRLVERGFLERADAAQGFKSRFLKKAFENFGNRRNRPEQAELEEFIRAQSYWLEDFSLFLAIREKEETSDWTKWDQGLRIRNPDAIMRAQKYFADEIRYHKFVQWQFSAQFAELKAYCTSKGIGLIGDVPHFVSHQSADVWAHPGLFKLDAGGNPIVVAGVPPDYFSKTGQVWGNPVYCWEKMAAENYSWWVQRLQTAFSRFDANRLDHFIGFVRFYEVSAQAQTAVDGQYQIGPGASFLQAVRKVLGPVPLIADDLGVRTSEVEALMEQFQIPGSKVLQFEFGSKLDDNSELSKQHPVRSVVYTGTHDNDTTEGWYRKLPNPQQKALQRMLGVDSQDIVWAMIRDAFASRADLAIVPVQDLLDLPSEARMNFPGIVKGNWQWRLKKGELSQQLSQRLRSITLLAGRL